MRALVAAIWRQLYWTEIGEPENQNMDLVPADFDEQLSRGCPKCGAAWREMLATGCCAVGVGCRCAPRAVRVRCHSGHLFDFDAHTGWNRYWTTHDARWGNSYMAVVEKGTER